MNASTFSLQNSQMTLSCGPISLQGMVRESEIDVCEDSKRGAVVIQSRLAEGTAPHWARPLERLCVTGAKRLFRTGLGFSGPTNFVPLPTDGTLFSYESYMITALEAEDGSALLLYTIENRQFLSKVEAYNRVHRHEFRNRRVTAAPIYLDVGFSTECIPVPADGLALPDVYCIAAPTTWDGVQRAARHIAEVNHARVPDEAPRYYCSWYLRESRFNREDLQRVIDSTKTLPTHFSTIQIDDGYCPHWGDWLIPKDIWPLGMAEAAQAIRDSGHAAGIWVAPMTVEEGSEVWKQHPDWVLKGLDGEPIIKMPAGGHGAGPHENRYALDLSHPGVRNYIRHVFTTLRAWGFTAYKTDFMDWGYADSTEVQRHTPGKTSAMWFDEALQIIRESIGNDSYWLACISYFPPFVGYCDGMRVSSDVGTTWHGAGGNGNDGIGGGIMNVLQESFHDQFFNNVLWANDPDCIFLRDYKTGLSEDETRSLALWSAMLGGTVTISDFFDDLPPHRLKVWEFLRFTEGAERSARLPYWGVADQPIYVAVRKLKDGAQAVFLLNPWDQAHAGEFPLQELVGMNTASVQSWTPEGLGEPSEADTIAVNLEPHQSALLRVE